MFTPCADIAKTNVVLKELSCSLRELAYAIKNPGSSSSSDIGDASAKNEIIELTGASSYSLPWTTDRKNKFGDSPVITTWLKDSEGVWVHNPFSFTTDDPIDPTSLEFNFGAPADVVIVIS